MLFLQLLESPFTGNRGAEQYELIGRTESSDLLCMLMSPPAEKIERGREEEGVGCYILFLQLPHMAAVGCKYPAQEWIEESIDSIQSFFQRLRIRGHSTHFWH